MWSSIEQIIKPDSLDEAQVLIQQSDAELFAGGSYLVAQKEGEIKTLIDINHLLDNNVETLGNDLSIDSGCTLQHLLSLCGGKLSQVIQASCPSKNIRNQRTIGGEIAKGRPDSDLLIFLFAARAKLQLSHTVKPIDLSDWDGNGIITRIIVPTHKVKLERVAVLDSAPAYIIVGSNESDDQITISVGGKITKIVFYQANPEPEELEVRNFLDEVEAAFTDDHLGTASYKRHVVGALLQEMVGV